MKAFVVSVNGKRLWTLGIGPNGVFNVIVGCGIGGPRRPAEGYFHFDIGGLDARTDEHVKWETPTLKLGDSVTIDLVDVEDFDAETSRYMFDASPDGKKPQAKLKGGARSKVRKPTPKRTAR